MNKKISSAYTARTKAPVQTPAAASRQNAEQLSKQPSKLSSILLRTPESGESSLSDEQQAEIVNISHYDLVNGLNDNQTAVLKYIIVNCGKILSYKQIASELQIAEGTVRGNIAKLSQAGFITHHPVKSGKIQGNAFGLNESLCCIFSAKHEIAFHFPVDEDPSALTDPATASATSPQIDRSLLTIKNNLLALTQQDLSLRFPKLAEFNLSPKQIKQFVDTLEKHGFPLDDLLQSLDYLNWELEQGPIRDKAGDTVESPLGYLFNAIRSTGYYRRPKGFISPDEQKAYDLELAGRAVLEAYKKAADVYFQIWLSSLAPSERKEILLRKRGPEMPFLRYYWEQNIKSSMLSNYREILSEILSKFSKLDSDAKSDEA